MKHVALVQIGIGTVGGEVVAQVVANRERWQRQHGLDLTIGAVVDRAGALVAEDLAALSDEALIAIVSGRRAGRALRDATPNASLVPADEAIARVVAERPTIVLDAATGDETAPRDARALASGAGVVLSNKAPLALPGTNPLSGELWAAAAGGHLRYEATCGAGLPVISTLRALLDTGDEVLEIQGMLSGTLGAIFTDIGAGRLFSAAVREAKQKGYTEPDPRDDLSGLDVARKALILARTIGRQLDLSEITVENLVPDHLRRVELGEFLQRVSEADGEIARRAATAATASRTLKYVATVTPDQPITVAIREIARGGVLGTVLGPENVITIRTRRYDAHPLTVVGPGAGAAVTAAGMLADVLALATGPLAHAG